MARVRRSRLRLREGEGEERCFEDRMLLRAPRLFRSGFSVVLRLRGRSLLRRLFLRRALRQAFAALNRQDLDVLLARYDPSIEVHIDDGPDTFPDISTHYEGVEGARDVMERFVGAWESVRWEPIELVDGGKRFVVLLHMSGVGRGGIELQEPLGAEFAVERGRVVSQSLHWSWDDTLRGAGLADE